MCHDNKNNSNSLFIMGLITGAIIASIVILVSAEDKAKIVKKIKNKFSNFFNDKVEPIIKKEKKLVKKTKKIISANVVKPLQKISVTLPKDVEALNLTPQKTLKPKKVFKKSK